MKKNIFVICMVMAAGCTTTLTAQTKGSETLVPLTKRVNVQADSARNRSGYRRLLGSCRREKGACHSTGFYMFVQRQAVLSF